MKTVNLGFWDYLFFAIQVGILSWWLASVEKEVIEVQNWLRVNGEILLEIKDNQVKE